MGTESFVKRSSRNLTVAAAASAPTGTAGATQWFSAWSGATAIPTGFVAADRVLVFPASATAIALTANYIDGDTLNITQPAGNVGVIVVSPAIPNGAVGYPPGTVLTFTFVAAAGSATPYVNAWTGPTAIPSDANVATITTDNVPAVINVSATYTATKPAPLRLADIATPSGAPTLISITEV